MNQDLMEKYFEKAEDTDYLVIDLMKKSLTIKKRFMDYSFLKKGYYLQIIDKGRNEIFLIKTDSIEVVSLVKPKFKGMSWFEAETKSEVGA